MAGYRAGTGGGGVATLTAQKAAAKPKKRPVIGAVTRILDVVSRGQYASAGLAKGKGPKESLSMAWKGLQGKQKYTYSSVVKERLGIRGKPAAVLGFLGDVALDPTTYLSLGTGAVAKTALKEGAKQAGKQAAKGVAKEVSERTAQKLAKKAIKVEAKEAVKTGVSTGARKILNKQKDEALRAVQTKVPQKVPVPVGKTTQVAKATPVTKVAPAAVKKHSGSTLAGRVATPSPKKQLAEMAAMAAGEKGSKEFLESVGKRAAQKAAAPAATAAAKAAPAATKVLSQADDIMAKAASIAGKVADNGAELAGKGAQVAREATESAAPKVAGAADAALPALPTGRAIQLRVLGKTIGSSERAYKLGKRVTNPVTQSHAGQLVGRTFRTGHGLPENMRGVLSKHRGTSLQDYDTQLKDIQTTFSKTKPVDRKLVSAAIARGEVASLPDNLRPLAEYAMRHLDVLQPRKAMKDGKVKEAIERIGKRGQKLTDSDDIADVLARQYDKHFTAIAHEGFVKEVTKRFPDAMNTPEVKEAMERTARVFRPDSPEGAEWVRTFDKIQGIWKMAVTAPNPGFHIRNMMGDGFLNYLDGVVNPEMYAKAMKILSKRGTVRVKVGKEMLSGDDVMMRFREHGLQSRFAQAENVMGGGHHAFVNKIGDYSNHREDWTRLTHFMDAMKKESGKGGTIDDIAERAAARVRKFNIDYSDLTDSEKSLKRVMPFYTFARKALPTQLEMVFTRPGRLAALPKGKQAIERLTGVRGEDDEGPLPGIDEALPPWLRDKFSISRGNNRIITPDLPIDLLGDYSNPVKGVLGGLTPAIKAPFELATGKSIPYGLNQKQSIPQYMLNQTPITRQIANRLNFGPFTPATDPNEKTKGWLAGPFQSKNVAKPDSGGNKGTAKKVAARAKGGKAKAGAGYRAGS